MIEYFHDIENSSVLCVENCTPVFTQSQKNAGLVVITPEIYEYLLVKYEQVSVPLDLKMLMKRCYKCNTEVVWLSYDGRCVKCTRTLPQEVHGG